MEKDIKKSIKTEEEEEEPITAMRLLDQARLELEQKDMQIVGLQNSLQQSNKELEIWRYQAIKKQQEMEALTIGKNAILKPLKHNGKAILIWLSASILLSLTLWLAGCKKSNGNILGPSVTDDLSAPSGWSFPRYPQTYDDSFWTGGR